MPIFRAISVLLLILAVPAVAVDDSKAQVDLEIKDDSWVVPPDLMMRARVKAITPSKPTNIDWRIGGEGLGGNVTRGSLGEELEIGEWSAPVSVKSFIPKGQFPAKFFLTVTCGNGGKRKPNDVTEGHSQNVVVEFEFSYKDKVVKTFTEKGPEGGTVGILIPAGRLSGGITPASPEFLEELGGIESYVRRRMELLTKSGPAARPKQYSIFTDLQGYGEGAGYGIRQASRDIVELECKTLRQMGVNGLAGAPAFLKTAIAAKEGYATEFSHALYLQLGGYPVPAAKPGKQDSEAGCPWAPGVASRTAEMIDRGVAAALKTGVKEVWWRTEDEIGSIFDSAPEGKAHLAVCPRCADAFRTFLKNKGHTPKAFGVADWNSVVPTNLFTKESPSLKTREECLTAYETSIFVNYSSAKLFTPLRDKLAQINDDKIKNNKTDQPFIYSFALRGNTFLMNGHSLDFFDFYRLADNALVYETSNRDIRITGWDSYLCDVGRVVAEKQKIKFGVYVKPHRGAPIQRTLAAVSRNAQMLYWYTYGPDYAKGDTFAESTSTMMQVARVSGMIGEGEEALFNSKWMVPAEVAVVNPRSSEFWTKTTKAGPAAYENAKWTYSALQHAHVPVDAIDEIMLETEDLTRYKVIYVSGPNLRRAAAEKIAAWVRAGGTLYTSGGGLMRDEANQPLDVLQPILGLQARKDPEMYYKVGAYGATKLDIYDDPRNVIAPVPAGAEVSAQAPFTSFKPVVGREALQPVPEAKVLARFADGAAALICSTAGKGKVYVAGTFPGLEYSVKVRREDFDMTVDFEAGLRSYISFAALERVKPVVSSSEPLVEGVLLKNDAGKRCVTVSNWAYRVTGKRVVNKKTSTTKSIITFKDVKLTLRGAGAVSSAKSLALNKPVQVSSAGDETILIIPELNEGDILILE